MQIERTMRALTLTLLLLLGACSSTGPQLQTQTPRAPVAVPDSPGMKISSDARAMVGVSYRYGGSAPETGFDCSGLVYFAYRQNGISVPRTSREQFRVAKKIALGAAREGDIVFFQDQEKLSHVGIYLGEGLFVHAPSTGRTVSIASLEEPYYQRNLVAVGRLLPGS
jgi:cell wall-associated NlpC family hydrolase